MLCPHCEKDETQVMDSREASGAVRRRRACLGCHFRFTTFERMENHPLIVIKKDGRREPFNQEKLISGLKKACQKRPISAVKIESIANEIEQNLYEDLHPEITSKHIGELVMRKLKKLDPIAYIRFASVYRSFEDIASFEQALHQLKSKK